MTPPPAGWADHPAAAALAARHRLRAWESIPWALALAFYFVFPKHLGFGTELLVTTLFAISLDLVLGYAGIVTLGHAAFFGAGAYTVGMLAKLGIWNEPLRGQSLRGIRENMLRMHAVGAPVRGRLVLCYTVSAAIAGVAGGVWAQANAYVNLGTLGLDRAATVLIILVLGGYGRLYGAFVGAVA